MIAIAGYLADKISEIRLLLNNRENYLLKVV